MTYPENDIKSEENEFDTRVARECSTSLAKSSAVTVTPSTATSSAKPATKPHCVWQMTRTSRERCATRGHLPASPFHETIYKQIS